MGHAANKILKKRKKKRKTTSFICPGGYEVLMDKGCCLQEHTCAEPQRHGACKDTLNCMLDLYFSVTKQQYCFVSKGQIVKS